jgi:hypothetical protein
VVCASPLLDALDVLLDERFGQAGGGPGLCSGRPTPQGDVGAGVGMSSIRVSQEAADQAAVSAYNTMSPAYRLKRLKR